MPMEEQPNMTKSRSGDAFMPMASADGCRWPILKVADGDERWLLTVLKYQF